MKIGALGVMILFAMAIIGGSGMNLVKLITGKESEINDRPVIGILTQEFDTEEGWPKNATYILKLFITVNTIEKIFYFKLPFKVSIK